MQVRIVLNCVRGEEQIGSVELTFDLKEDSKLTATSLAQQLCAAADGCTHLNLGIDHNTGAVSVDIAFGNELYDSACIRFKDWLAGLQLPAETTKRSLPYAVQRRVDAGMSLNQAWLQAG